LGGGEAEAIASNIKNSMTGERKKKKEEKKKRIAKRKAKTRQSIP